MHKHARQCWGKALVDKANSAKSKNVSVDDIRAGLASAKLKDGSITASFEQIGKGRLTYSARQHTYPETR
jgi:hypothetical protein